MSKACLHKFLQIVAKSDECEDKIQLNDRISSVDDIKSFIYAERAQRSEAEVPLLTTSIKADNKSSVGTITDIKIELRDVEALKVNYSTIKGSALDNVK